jgi:hypothetical protein
MRSSKPAGKDKLIKRRTRNARRVVIRRIWVKWRHLTSNACAGLHRLKYQMGLSGAELPRPKQGRLDDAHRECEETIPLEPGHQSARDRLPLIQILKKHFI